jgi:hypothetical protein
MNTNIDTSQLSIEQKKNLVLAAINTGADWHIDELDCAKSWCRQKIDMKVDEILDRLDDESHFVFILRGDGRIDLGFSLTDGLRELFLFVAPEPEPLITDWFRLVTEKI